MIALTELHQAGFARTDHVGGASCPHQVHGSSPIERQLAKELQGPVGSPEASASSAVQDEHRERTHTHKDDRSLYHVADYSGAHGCGEPTPGRRWHVRVLHLPHAEATGGGSKRLFFCQLGWRPQCPCTPRIFPAGSADTSSSTRLGRAGWLASIWVGPKVAAISSW